MLKVSERTRDGGRLRGGQIFNGTRRILREPGLQRVNEHIKQRWAQRARLPYPTHSSRLTDASGHVHSIFCILVKSSDIGAACNVTRRLSFAGGRSTHASNPTSCSLFCGFHTTLISTIMSQGFYSPSNRQYTSGRFQGILPAGLVEMTREASHVPTPTNGEFRYTKVVETCKQYVTIRIPNQVKYEFSIRTTRKVYE